MIDPAAYDRVVADLDDLVGTCRRLGLFRTAEQVHQALATGRAERFEAQPREAVTIEFEIGPVREQPLTSKGA